MELGKGRDFCDVLSSELTQGSVRADKLSWEVINKTYNEVIGHLLPFETVFGLKPLVYADWTASGRTVDSIEKYINQNVSPYYGNTHTTTSITGTQSTAYRHESRQIIAESVNARITGRAAEDVVLFCGNGSTSAIHKLILALGLNMPLSSSSLPDDRPVVLVSSYEHHSNLIPWRETIADVIIVNQSPTSSIDLVHLDSLLVEYSSRKLKIGSFSACSNVTGIMTNVKHVASLMHRHHGLVFIDYAAAAPYVPINMNASSDDWLDAIFISGHKFIGGPGASGILVCKKKLLNNPCPTIAGGGAIFYSASRHVFLSNQIEREESGTPNILGDIKAGLVFLLKRQMGNDDDIMRAELSLARSIRLRLLSINNLLLLGCQHEYDQLPIFSFLIKVNQTGKYLHYNFICKLLNDLFGIQSRGGCQCAGPYSQYLLGLTDGMNDDIARVLGGEKFEYLRPGYCRISLPFFMPEHEVSYIIQAIEFLCEYGVQFLNQYRMNVKTGEFFHSSQFNRFPTRRWISHFSAINTNNNNNVFEGWPKKKEDLLESMLEQARSALLSLSSSTSTAPSTTVSGLYWYLSQDDDDDKNQNNESTDLMSPDLLDELICLASELPIQSVRRPHQATEDAPIYQQADMVQLITSHTGSTVDVVYRGEDRGVDDVDEMKSRRLTTGSTLSITKKRRNNIPNAPDNGKMVFPYSLLSSTSNAIKQWDMIQDGDKLLLGLSGGKDSMTLLHVLLRYQKHSFVRFELATATVDPQTPSYNPASLTAYVTSLGVQHHYLSESIIENAGKSLIGDSLCAYCARMKRGMLYTCCRTFGYNKLVLGQHLDDLAESWLMSAFHNGLLRTMKANYVETSGIRVIRPLIFTRERETRNFALTHRLPIINENCPACFEQPKERARIKALLAREESMCANLFGSLKGTMLPLMDEGIYDQFDIITNRLAEKKKRVSGGQPSPRRGNKEIKVASDKVTDILDDELCYFSSDSIQSKP